MRIIKEEPLSRFEFWCGAKNTASYLTINEFDIIENILEELYPDGITETEINDLFWFEPDLIAEWLGYNDFEEIMNEGKI